MGVIVGVADLVVSGVGVIDLVGVGDTGVNDGVRVLVGDTSGVTVRVTVGVIVLVGVIVGRKII